MKFRILYCALFFCLLCQTAFGQQDTTLFRLYKDKLTVYSLTGYNATNVAINPKFSDFERQRYMLNPPLLFGMGVAYKGIDLGFSRRLSVNLMNSTKYGKSDYSDFKLKFSISRIHIAVRAQKYTGFSLLNHEYDEQNLPKPHLFIEDFSTFSLNLDARYFFKENFNYSSALGFSGEYLRDFISPYIYTYTGGSNVKNETRPLLADYVIDESATISNSNKVGCIEFGAIPGFAVVKRYNNIQATMLLGWGPLIQTKWHTVEKTRAFFGLSSRTDLQWSVGYHKEKWFVQLISEFQFRRMNFRQMNVQQYYYDLRVFFGYLIPVKKHPKVILDLESRGLL